MIVERDACHVCGGKKLEEVATRDHRAIARCGGCGHLLCAAFDTDRLEGTATKDAIAEADGAWGRLCDSIERARTRLGSVLDVGAGTGGFLLTLRRRHPDARLAACESSEDAQGEIMARVPGIETMYTQASRLSEVSERYDVATVLRVLDRVLDPAMLCRDVHRLLGEGGMMVIAVPNAGTLKGRFQGPGKADGPFADASALQFFTAAALERLLKEAGFSRVTPVTDGVGFLARLLGTPELRLIAWK